MRCQPQQETKTGDGKIIVKIERRPSNIMIKIKNMIYLNFLKSHDIFYLLRVRTLNIFSRFTTTG